MDIEKILDLILDLLASEKYGLVCTIILILMAIYLVYNKIKYKCFEQVCQFVAMVEENKELSGEGKFLLVKEYVNKQIKITNNSIMNKLVEKIIQYVYDNSKKYAINYIARKTNVEANQVQEILNMAKTQIECSEDN